MKIAMPHCAVASESHNPEAKLNSQNLKLEGTPSGKIKKDIR
jgi:hypothetical protein